MASPQKDARASAASPDSLTPHGRMHFNDVSASCPIRRPPPKAAESNPTALCHLALNCDSYGRVFPLPVGPSGAVFPDDFLPFLFTISLILFFFFFFQTSRNQDASVYPLLYGCRRTSSDGSSYYSTSFRKHFLQLSNYPCPFHRRNHVPSPFGGLPAKFSLLLINLAHV